MSNSDKRSSVEEFYKKNGRFPTDEETFELIDSMVDEMRDRRFMSRVSDMFDREYPGRVHCAWMIGSLSDRHEDPMIVHSSDISDPMDRLYLGHKIHELTGLNIDIYTDSLLKTVQSPIAAALSEKYTPVLFYKRDSAREPDIRKSRFSAELTEDLTELLKMMFPKDIELSFSSPHSSLDDALDAMRDSFFKANGFIPTEEECVRIVDDVRKEIRREKEWEEEVKREYEARRKLKGYTDEEDD